VRLGHAIAKATDIVTWFASVTPSTSTTTPRGHAIANAQRFQSGSRVGDRVEAGNLECASDHFDKDTIAIDLEVPDPHEADGIFLVELARPRSWLDAHDVGNGEVEIYLDEADMS
jgi:hypothetical protein